MGKAFDAADFGDWAGFVQVMGGPFCTKNDQSVQLSKLSATDQMTGEIRLNQYMEPASDQVYGVEADGVSICTREHEWRIQTRPVGDDDLLYRSDLDSPDLTYSSGLSQVDLQGLSYRSKSGQNAVIRNITGMVPELGPESSGTEGRRVPELGPESSRTGPENFENRFRTGFDPLEFCQ